MITNPESIPLEETAAHYPLKIILADDQLMNRQLLGKMLNYLGYDYHEASNGKEALMACHQTPADCILMDVNMPEMDGVEATKKIREWEIKEAKGKRRLIVAITANAMIGDRERFLASGMDIFLPKPLKIREIRNVLIECFLKLSLHSSH